MCSRVSRRGRLGAKQVNLWFNSFSGSPTFQKYSQSKEFVWRDIFSREPFVTISGRVEPWAGLVLLLDLLSLPL